MFTSAIAAVLLVLIFAFVGYSLFYHRKSCGYQADQHFHETWFGQWSWVIVPVLVLGIDLTIANSHPCRDSPGGDDSRPASGITP